MTAGIVLPGLLALGGLGLYVLAMAFGRPFRWRRAVQGALFLTLAGIGAWIDRGGSLGYGFSRAYVVVFGDELSGEDRSRILATLGGDSQVTLLRLRPVAAATPAAPDLKSAEWVRADQVTGSTQAIELECDPEGWSEPLIRACHDLVAARGWSWFSRLGVRPAVVVVPDKAGVWRGLRVAKFDLESLAATLARAPRADLFVIDPPSASPLGRLEIVLSRPSFPATNLANIPELVGLRLTDAPVPVPGKAARYSAWLDGPLAGDEAAAPDGSTRYDLAGELTLTTEPGTSVRTASFAFGELHVGYVKGHMVAAGSDRLGPGFHRLTVRLEVPTLEGGLERSEVYTATRNLLVEERGMVLFVPKRPAPDHTLGDLADASWEGTQRPASVPVLLDQFLALAPTRGQSTRLGDIVAKSTFSLPTARYAGRGALDAVGARLYGLADASKAGQVPPGPGRVEIEDRLRAVAAAKLVVLVEPSYSQLVYLDALLGLDRRIDEGLTVLVIGPPPAGAPGEPVAGLPGWLPAFARPADLATPGAPLRVDREARIFVLPDNARPLQFSAPDGGGEYTPLDAQKDVLDRLYAAIGAHDAAGAALAPTPATVVEGKVFGHAERAFGSLSGPGGPRPVVIVPPLTHLVSGLPSNLVPFHHTPLGGVEGGLGWLMDTAPSWLPMRLALSSQNSRGVTCWGLSSGESTRRTSTPRLL